MVVSVIFEIPSIQPGEPWPFRGSLEEMLAARAKVELVEREFGKNTREYRAAAMSFHRLKRLKKGVKRAPSKLRADAFYKLTKQEASARNAVAAFQKLADKTDVSALMQSIVDLMTQYGPKILEERLRAGDYRAFRDCAALVDKLLARQEARAPKQKVEKRQIVVREWPAEGAKA